MTPHNFYVLAIVNVESNVQNFFTGVSLGGSLSDAKLYAALDEALVAKRDIFNDDSIRVPPGKWTHNIFRLDEAIDNAQDLAFETGFNRCFNEHVPSDEPTN